MCEDKCCEPAGRDACVSYMGCNSIAGYRRFLSREEEIGMLEKYMEELEKEIKGVKRKIQELRD